MDNHAETNRPEVTGQGSRSSGRARTLIALNLVLVAGVFWSSVDGGAASAQTRGAAGQAARARGEYTMVAGKLNQGGPAGVYVIDATNQEIVALQWDQTKNSLIGVGYRDLKSDSKALPSR
jgi:hypothetical protein